MPSGRAFQSSTAWQTKRCWSHERFDCGLQMLLLKRVLWSCMSLKIIKLKFQLIRPFKDLKTKNRQWDLRLFSNISQPSRSRASVADECFGIFKINLAALFWSNWILFISVVLDLSPQVTSAWSGTNWHHHGFYKEFPCFSW